ncbi:glycerophosphodiester phosphodiesterase [Agromyces sp. MMS17-SY077]|uniref:Glycerophosphodiester phosphodiesterase n=1 Tax=Agromyces seonyuensis TaxID=2662446 RepID=A0A6I4NUR1_9MICO|nr:glycerophosphodiester phosphodiesterase [Agromyces seonyuensis]
MRSRYFDGPTPRVLAHRGLALESPENTVGAFAAALSAGADSLETDVHASRDGVAIVSHDPDLERVAGRRGRIGDFTVIQLASIDLGGGEHPERLEDVLVRFPDARFNIDVKQEAALGPAIEAVLAADAADRVLLTSFDDGRRMRLAERLPGVATSGGRRAVILCLVGSWFGSTALVRAGLRGAGALQVPERAGFLRIVSARFLRIVHRAGAEVHVWTVNDPEDMRRLLDLGVDGLVTDRCDLAVPLVAARRGRRSDGG